jgi:peptidoglycan/xylan/chitin deacetylase (PgdA/CDA1 family)
MLAMNRDPTVVYEVVKHDMNNLVNQCLRLRLAVCFLALLVIVFSPDLCRGDKGKKDQVKEVCITFDELPAAKGFQAVDKNAITYLILGALKRHDVRAAGFVVGEDIEGAADLLGQWLNDGHTLGSMTYSNPDLHVLGIEQFISDVKTGAEAVEPMLNGFGQKQRYFRYPFLHYGNTVEAREQVALFLEHKKLRVAHATVVVEDYLYNLTLEKLGKVPDSVEYESLLNEYVNHVLDEVERAEKAAMQMVGRPVRQILQLRANRLNAVYLDEMLSALEDMGYTFIDLGRALKDEVYRMNEAYFGAKGVGYLDMIRLSNPDLIPAE